MHIFTNDVLNMLVEVIADMFRMVHFLMFVLYVYL
jgi:hypothetical protein